MVFQGGPGPVEAVRARLGARTACVRRPDWASRAADLKSQQQGQPLSVLVVAAVADLVKAEVPFQGVKRMLNFGPQ